MSVRPVLGALVLLLALLTPATAQAITLPPGFEDIDIVTGLDLPVAAAYAPDGRLFVAEKAGQVRVASATGALQAAPLVDLRSEVATYEDRGLLGIAVDADFATNGYLYVLHTAETDGGNPMGPKTSRLLRYVVSPQNLVSNRTTLLGSVNGAGCPAAPPASNTVDCIPSEGTSHSIGSVRSAPDGTLWLGSGDAASYTTVDPLALRAYDPTTPAGKILHVDRNGRGLPTHPYCPGETDLSRMCTKVAAVGLRNPFRFVLRDGLPVVGDVGWELREEIDLLQPGRNYGWPCYEGDSQTPGYRQLPECQALYRGEGPVQRPVTPPDLEYLHAGQGASIQAGPQYQGTEWPAGYRGTWFVGDFNRTFIKRYEIGADGEISNLTDFATGYYGTELLTHPGSGDLVYVDIGASKIVRVSYTPGNRTPVATIAATPTSGAAPLQVDFSSAGTHDPDGDALSYAWEFGDGTTSTQPNPTHEYGIGNHTARVTVSDGRGRSTTRTVAISAGNTAPTVDITSPADGSTYRAGGPVELRATASDAQDGPLTGAALRWDVRVNHNEHLHYLQQMTGTAPSFLATDTHDADSFHLVRVTATDSHGATATRSIRLDPARVRLTMGSEPEGALLTYSGVEFGQTRVADAASGFRTDVTAPAEFSAGGRTYRFASWSDGGARAHAVTVPAQDASLVARYEAVPLLVPTPTPSPSPSPSPSALAPSATPFAELPAPTVSTTPGPTPTAVTTPVRLSFEQPFSSRRDPVHAIRGRLAESPAALRVQVAISRPWKGSSRRCTWWSPRRGRFGSPTRCDAPAFFTARVRRTGVRTYAWHLALRGRLAPATYGVELRALDAAGRPVPSRIVAR